MRHAEAFVKVNAAVDEGIVDLVEALSQFPELVTIESCQGDPAGVQAFVFFRFGSWRKCGEFLFDRLLPTLPPDLMASTAFTVTAYSSDHALGQIYVDPAGIGSLASKVRELAMVARPKRDTGTS